MYKVIAANKTNESQHCVDSFAVIDRSPLLACEGAFGRHLFEQSLRDTNYCGSKAHKSCQCSWSWVSRVVQAAIKIVFTFLCTCFEYSTKSCVFSRPDCRFLGPVSSKQAARNARLAPGTDRPVR